MTPSKPDEEKSKLRGDELMADLHTRESSTLTIATIASSASLVLLGLYPFVPSNLPIAYWGLLFPFAGLAYRELTTLSIDRLNQREFKELRGNVRNYPGWVTGIAILRKLILLTFLASPSALWLPIINKSFAVGIPLLSIFVVSLLIVGLESLVDHLDKTKGLVTPIDPK